MPSFPIPMTISTFLAPPPSLTKLSLNEWVSIMTTKTLDPRKKDPFMYKDEQMPFGGVMSLKSAAREKPNDHKASPTFLADTLELYSSFPEYGSPPNAIPRPPPSSLTLVLHAPSSFSLDPPHSHKNSKPHKKPLKIKLSSYHAYPALHQAMEAHEANHHNHVESIHINYYNKHKSDVEDITKIISLLHRTLDSHEFKIMAMIDTAAALTCQTHSLDEQHRKLKETESETVKNHKDSVDLYAKAIAGQGQSQVDKFSQIFTLAADIVSQEETSSNPFFTFKLHR
ncbi:hypothetical protein BS47DRAFT_1399629 [Hydnum rufescens UP504]|uniref:Uncharacterized protein n=1 Tax=Hydnum rufescens UP504 TaxID=1448309 RepID=A0A9P6AI91_9AGAM|nr:hypothetical protein BS47DRAFT_1399629 [Hydnum rufescens UP504]